MFLKFRMEISWGLNWKFLIGFEDGFHGICNAFGKSHESAP